MSGGEEKAGSVWRIDREETWPPSGRVRPPVSPSLYHTVSACWLRATFAVSSGYPRKSSPYARLGTAFHDILENLPRLMHTAGEPDRSNPKVIRARAVEMLRRAVKREKERALKNPREAKDLWPEHLEQRMEVQAALAAGRLAGQAHPMPSSKMLSSEGHSGVRPSVSLEETLTSDDGLLKGRPDRVEQSPTGAVVVDYKTGSLDNPANLERYEQQCLFYAWLWHDRHGDWPSRYQIVNPLTGKDHGGDVDSRAAKALAEDARRLAQRLEEDHPSPEEQASPGEACASCEFRPWCEPFWLKAARPTFEVPAYGDRKRVSVQGVVREVRTQGTAGNRQAFVHLRIEGGALTLQAPLPDFDHVGGLLSGERVRVLDALVSPEDEGWLRLDGRSEAFVLVR